MIDFIMKYSFECKRARLGYLRVVLPAELEYFSDFIEDIVSVDEADEYLKMIQDVLDGSSEEYEIQLNTTIAYIKEDQTVIEHLYTENENDRSSMETEKFKKLILDWRDKIPQRYKSDD
ncbi:MULTISPECIES: tRNA-Val4 [Bacillus]|uniref:tRNA-Val4 n=1 Tax=Bacillus TaxID=1386 RepID=UPI000BA71D78|nr:MULTISPECIES: tRNA-Val4 [Bacillus]MDH3080586.1 tRNA-Val4 [Bacillus amyloliquefaciens]MDU0077319.1 tRNA-Val4 [Bacillus sp. IG2]MDU0102248.1 tRNA-Val4 [Bacillus sp. IS1]MEC2273004.1 tRNA-Val4 [Bacillus velezensis]MED3681344.1 tRNA-Val4 [Bacillus velezensis]